ncbi:MAG TPA: hypothetical protein VFO37_11745, partial [Chitinophagaceae bacterium]|nr:hypothetical protein [Chitinophagaceae bacterium]
LKPDNLLTYRNCPLPIVLDFCPDSAISPPEPNPYFADAMNSYNYSVKNEHLTDDTVDKTSPQNIHIDPFSLQPGSTVNIEIHSDPINLGDYTVQQDGGLSEDIILPPTIPAGFHTLHIYGNSYSGESVDLTQVIEVQGSVGDIDEDGIADSSDPCLYVPAANIDADFDGIDDGCDPQIDGVQPYRVRNGDTTIGEDASHLFIERNIRASSITGIIGDYDPDNNGWAIVAKSKNEADSGLPANFWVDDNKVPHVSIRTPDKGCVQFTPASLKVIKANKDRYLKREANNTNTCRPEAASDDVDSNGVSDNQQTLYRAHNGNPANGEDPQSIYLERNTTAAETQLGLSDYDHEQPWNLLASSQNEATKATFVKLVIKNDEN